MSEPQDETNKELKNQIYTRLLDHTEQQIQARIQFREQRFYWLYVGSCAIAAFLFDTYKDNSDVYRSVFYGSMLLIQFLTIGIGWNYYSNDIKIHKLEWKKNEIIWKLDLKPAEFHEKKMNYYCNIYTVLEIFAICIPSASAFGALIAMNVGTNMAHDEACSCGCHIVSAALTPCTPTLVSAFLLAITLIGTLILGLCRKDIFQIKNNVITRTPGSDKRSNESETEEKNKNNDSSL